MIDKNIVTITVLLGLCSIASATRITFGHEIDTPLPVGTDMGIQWSDGKYTISPDGSQDGDVQNLNSGTPGQLDLPAIGVFSNGLTMSVAAYDNGTPVVVSAITIRIRPTTVDGTAFFPGDSLVFTFSEDVEIESIGFTSATEEETAEISVDGEAVYSGPVNYSSASPLDLGRVPLNAGQELTVLAENTDGFHVSTLTVTSIGAGDAILPANIFSSGCVIQRDIPGRIWGTAQPGETVTVTVHDQVKTGVADLNGLFDIVLDSEPAGGPYDLVLSGSISQSVTLYGIWFGDVWLCTGQSNMARTLSDFKSESEYPEYYANIPDAGDDFDNVRFCYVQWATSETEESEVGMFVPWARWENGGNLLEMSATGYFFGRALKDALDTNGQSGIPLGFIACAMGATAIEEWISQEALNAMNPVPTGLTRPSGRYNGMFHPIERYAIKGVVWYQGEANSSSLSEVLQYPRLKETLVNSWRETRGVDFPFYYVQLAGYMPYSLIPDDTAAITPKMSWAWIREAQAECLSISNTAMAVILDTGDQNNIHPSGKEIVGERLALIALNRLYNVSVVDRGPTLRSYEIIGSDIILTFDNVGGGLEVKEVNAQPDDNEISQGVFPVHAYTNRVRGFALCGSDQTFYWATDAEIIQTNKLRISNAADVPVPVAVRYAWQSFPCCNLYGGTGLPAEPFRTDSFTTGSFSAADSTPVAGSLEPQRGFNVAGEYSLDLNSVFSDIEDSDAARSLTFSVLGNTDTNIVSSVSVSSNQLILTYAAVQGKSTIRVKAADSSDNQTEFSFDFAVETNTYRAWQHRVFTEDQLLNPSLEASLWGDQVDMDGDGIVNLMEFVYGTSPSEVNSGTDKLTIYPGNDSVIIQYRKSKDTDTDPEVSIILEHTVSLIDADWQELLTGDISVDESGNIETRRISVPIDELFTFVRLRVTRSN